MYSYVSFNFAIHVCCKIGEITDSKAGFLFVAFELRCNVHSSLLYSKHLFSSRIFWNVCCLALFKKRMLYHD